MRPRTSWAVLAVLLLGACSGQAPQEGGTALSPAAPATSATQDAATRTTPLVPGHPGRVFVFAGVGDNCESLPAPQITVDQSPQKGEITFKPGQTTTIAASKSGKCIGSTASGTGVYYTAREGTLGTDTFALTARMTSGETLTRSFSVTIAP
jgi:hypothetical protein